MYNHELLPDTTVRQAAMAVKCMLLLYYKNCRGRNYRRQVTYFSNSYALLCIIFCFFMFVVLRSCLLLVIV